MAITRSKKVRFRSATANLLVTVALAAGVAGTGCDPAPPSVVAPPSSSTTVPGGPTTTTSTNTTVPTNPGTSTTTVPTGQLVVNRLTSVPGSPGGAYVYYPSTTPSRRLIVFVHGGAGTIGSVNELPWWVKDLTTQGWNVASADYRRSAGVASVNDAADTVRYLQQALGATSADTVLFGHSLGSRITELIAFGANNNKSYGVKVARVVALAPFHYVWGMAQANYVLGSVVVSDITLCNPGIFNLLGFHTCSGTELADAEPRNLIDKGDPPVFAGVFDQDPVLPPDAGAVQLSRDLAAAGCTGWSFVNLPGLFHDSDNPADPTQATMRAKIIDWITKA